MAVPGKKAKQKLSSSLFRGSGEDFEVFCQPCDRDDIRLPAFGYCLDCEEHLCEPCFNTHRRPKPLRHHKLLDKDHMPHTQNVSTTSSSPHVGQSDDLTNPCSKHNKEVTKFYCHDHKALLCSVCVTLEHTRTSCHIDYIPDISVSTIDSTEFKDTLTELDSITGKCQKIKADQRKKVATSNTSLTGALAEITKFRKEINQRLDKLENAVKDAAKSLQQENDTGLKYTEETCDDITKALKASSDRIKQLNTTKKADKLFMKLKNAEQLVQDNEKRMSQLRKPENIKEYMFEPSQTIKSLLQNEKSLGSLTAKILKQPNQPSAPASVSKTKFNRKICVKTSSDKICCSITGITSPLPNQIFVADYDNKDIKMVDINSQAIQQLNLDSWPCDITTISREELAVTVPGNSTIQVISYSSNRLCKKHSLKVDGHCHSISYCQGKLAVTFIFPGKLQIMDLKGTVLTTVKTNSKSEKIFESPQYVTTNSNAIYVSDREMQAVIWLNWQGELMGSYGGMGFPQGLAMLDDGSFFVIDMGNNKCNILNVTGDCKESKIVLNDLDYPKAICLYAASSTMCISNYSDTEKERNSIQIYKMS